MTRSNEEPWLTPAQVAQILQLSVDDVMAALREGELPGVEIRGHWRVRRAALHDFLGDTPVDVSHEQYVVDVWSEIVEERLDRVVKQLKTLGPRPVPPEGGERSRQTMGRWFFEVMAWDLQHSEITMTPREQAEAAWTPTCDVTVDELEDRIREGRGLPPIDRETGFQRWDLVHTEAEREELETEARKWAEDGLDDNPQGLSFEDYLEVWRGIVGLIPSAPIDPREELAQAQGRLARARGEVVDE